MHTATLAIEDLAQFSAVGSLSVSADEKYLAYVKTSVSPVADDYVDTIVIIDLSSGAEIKSLIGSEPKWSPISSDLAYLAPHQEANWLWIYSSEADNSRPLTPVIESHYFMGHLSLKNFAWSPDGLSIAYLNALAVANGPDDEARVVIDRLLYKTKGGRGRPLVTDSLRTHVWLADVRNGHAQALTHGLHDEHSLCWSPDGKRIAFVSNRSQDPDNNQQHDLWILTVADRSTRACVQGLGTVFQPVWSPDGSKIAFLAVTDKVSTNDSPASDTQLYVVDVTGGSPTCLTAALDRRVEQPQWHPQKDQCYFTAGDCGTTAIYRVDLNATTVDKIAGDHCFIQEFVLTGNGDQFYYVRSDNATPPEVYRQRFGTSYQLTKVNAAADKYDLQRAETFWFDSADGLRIQGWIMQPVSIAPTKKYPLALVIHGGPHNMFGYAWEERMQILAARGYGVLFINPRGSNGYGQAFSRGCVLNWGGGDYQDLMAGVDAALIRYPWIDAASLVVTGQSYGGFMTNWIITQTTRFRAAVADGGISNLISFAGTSLYHSLMESEFNGSAYDNFSLLWQWSPLRNIKSVRTPTLLLHGQADQEVPSGQAEEMYIALKKRGVETQFVQYIGEGHGWRPDLKPSNRYDVLRRIINWFDKHVQSAYSAAH